MSNSLDTTFIAQTVVPGTNYKWRVQARNIYGWGAYSEVSVISASGIPDQMAIPSTQAVSDDLVISWDYPVDANS